MVGKERLREMISGLARFVYHTDESRKTGKVTRLMIPTDLHSEANGVLHFLQHPASLFSIFVIA